MEKKILFSANNISKRYPGTVALKDFSMEIYAGEVVGLVGENGAGKSTLLKIIMGTESTSKGSMQILGEDYAPHNPIDANKCGIGMVFQEQSLIQNLTVGQNIFFGQEKNYTHFLIVNKNKMNEDAKKVLENIGINYIRTEKKISTLDFATRQMVEIAKVFNIVKSENSKGSIILLDEPTSVLNEDEVQNLFKNIRKICAEGNSVIFVSHRLDEILEISDRIYVLKDGQEVAEMDRENANEAVLYNKMVGKTAIGEYFKVARQTQPGNAMLLEVKNLGKRGYFKNVSFSLHRGEVIGICGVIGSGKEDFCSVVCGDDSPTSGEIIVKGEKRHFNTPHQALKNGILSIPQNRREEGIVSDINVCENINMSNYKAVMKNGLISAKKQKKTAQKFMDELSIKCASSNDDVGNLSGGNAQKVVFARILASDADILLLNHPTRGVDVGAKGEIYNLVRDITETGKGIILLGDTLDECIGLSNRVFVMKDGIITKEYNATPDHKPEQVDIIKYMM